MNKNSKKIPNHFLERLRMRTCEPVNMRWNLIGAEPLGASRRRHMSTANACGARSFTYAPYEARDKRFTKRDV